MKGSTYIFRCRNIILYSPVSDDYLQLSSSGGPGALPLRTW